MYKKITYIMRCCHCDKLTEFIARADGVNSDIGNLN